MAKECYYLGIEGRDTEIVRQGVDWLFQNTTEQDGGGWFAPISLRNLGNILEYPGLNELTLLSKNTSAVINGVRIYLITEHSIPADGKDMPLLVPHPTTEYLDKLDSIPNISKMMVIPWIDFEVDDWAKRNNAMSYGSTDLTSTAAIDKVVRVAIKQLTDALTSLELWKNNVGTKRYRIIETFLILHENGYELIPNGLERILIDDYDWPPGSARQAAEIAERIRSEDKDIRCVPRYLDSSILDIWRKEAEAF